MPCTKLFLGDALALGKVFFTGNIFPVQSGCVTSGLGRSVWSLGVDALCGA